MSLSGGGPVPPTLKQGWRDKLKTPLVESYGQSELGGFVALGYPEIEKDDSLLMRVGPPLPDKEVAVFDLQDKAQPVEVVGEIVVTGGFMKGYWGKPERTRDTTRGGWLHTGDIGFIDRDGYVLMRGRKSELIDVAGVSWYPRDVEEALCRQSGIRQAAVIGLADKVLGQRPAAFVIVQDGQKVSPEGLKQAIRPEVPYDIETLQIRVVDTLPMTPTGKISKAALQEQMAARA
jgi:acyl-coenzyme A synthetase/AMP-(fatty) acid ligase